MSNEITTTSQTAPATTKERPRTVADMLVHDKAFLGSLANALPKHITTDRMARVCLTAMRRTPGLLQTKPESLLAAILVCAQLGLEPNDPRQLAYLIPYGSECQLIIGYRGYIELAMRSGMVTNIQAMVVYERDEFEYEQGLELKLRHVPYLGTDDPGKVRCAYAIATMQNGTKACVVLPRRDIDRARMVSQTGKKNSGPWNEWYPEMAMKTAVRRLAKFMPQSPEFARALEADEARTLRIDPVTLDPNSVEIEPQAVEAQVVEPGEATPASEAQSADLKSRLGAKAEKASGVKTEMRPESRFGDGEAA